MCSFRLLSREDGKGEVYELYLNNNVVSKQCCWGKGEVLRMKVEAEV